MSLFRRTATCLLLCALLGSCGNDPRRPVYSSDAGQVDSGGVLPRSDGGFDADAPEPAVDAGASRPPYVDPCYEDDDALDADRERLAGLSPCLTDTNGDGCEDDEEVLLGGCSDPRRQKLRLECYNKRAAFTTLRFTVPAGPTFGWGTLSLLGPSDLELTIAAVDLPSHSTATGASVSGVRSGDQLSFTIHGGYYHDEPRVFEVRLVTEGGQIVDTGAVLIYVATCPIVI